jgi:DNA-binding NtrC family response regulator
VDLQEGDESIRTPAEDHLRVLVVEDEPLLQWCISEVLEDEGATVSQAKDAASALHALSAQAFDVVMLDLCLPDARDLTLLSSIRRRWPTCAVVMMTAYATADVLAEARQLGAYAILHKPFDLHGLPSVVSAAYRDRSRLSRH